MRCESNWRVHLASPSGESIWRVHLASPSGESIWRVHLASPIAESSWRAERAWRLRDPLPRVGIQTHEASEARPALLASHLDFLALPRREDGAERGLDHNEGEGRFDLEPQRCAPHDHRRTPTPPRGEFVHSRPDGANTGPTPLLPELQGKAGRPRAPRGRDTKTPRAASGSKEPVEGARPKPGSRAPSVEAANEGRRGGRQRCCDPCSLHVRVPRRIQVGRSHTVPRHRPVPKRSSLLSEQPTALDSSTDSRSR